MLGIGAVVRVPCRSGNEGASEQIGGVASVARNRREVMTISSERPEREPRSSRDLCRRRRLCWARRCPSTKRPRRGSKVGIGDHAQPLWHPGTGRMGSCQMLCSSCPDALRYLPIYGRDCAPHAQLLSPRQCPGLVQVQLRAGAGGGHHPQGLVISAQGVTRSRDALRPGPDQDPSSSR